MFVCRFVALCHLCNGFAVDCDSCCMCSDPLVQCRMTCCLTTARKTSNCVSYGTWHNNSHDSLLCWTYPMSDQALLSLESHNLLTHKFDLHCLHVFLQCDAVSVVHLACCYLWDMCFSVVLYMTPIVGSSAELCSAGVEAQS